jgi:hypothetical protein
MTHVSSSSLDPNVKVLGGVELERAAWKYVHQHEIRSQVRRSEEEDTCGI